MYGKHITLNVSPHNIDTTVHCDKRSISRVIINLLSNALKFSPEEKTISIEFTKGELTTNGDGDDTSVVPALTLAVVDEGIGIPDEELDAVFDKFIQSSKTKTGAGGTGLGLAICKDIIDHHHGKIWAENNPNGGATFNFSLPIAA